MLCYNELYHYNYIEALNPALKKGIVALFVTGTFGLLEAGLAVMLGILGASLTIRFKTLRYGLGFILWGIMVGLVLAIVIRVDRFALNILELEYEYMRPSTLRDWFNWIDRRHSAHILRMISLGIFSLGDGGTLISTNILRPYTPSAFNVLRNLVSAILGYWIYIFMIWGGLRLAQVMCVRNGASVPIKQPFIVQRLWRFFKHPVLKSQQHYIHYQHRQQKRRVRLGAVVLIALVFSGLLLFSAMPKWIYMDYTQKRLLYGMAGVLFLVHAIVGLRTLVVAGRSISREFSTGTWDLLALTNVDARQLILSKWWATVRGVWFYHVLAGVLKVGLACGIAQFFHSELRPWSAEPSVRQAFNYISYNQPYDYFPINPNWHAVLRAAVILVLFGLVEAGLLAAIGLLSSLSLRKIGSVQLMVGIGLRVLPILATLLLVNKVSEYAYGYARYRWYMDSPNAYITTNESINRTILFESAQVVGTTQIDGGVLASTNLLRVQPMRHYFLVRAFVNIGIGMGIHIMMTIGVLWLAQKQAIRRGLSPPQGQIQGTILSFKRLGLRV